LLIHGLTELKFFRQRITIPYHGLRQTNFTTPLFEIVTTYQIQTPIKAISFMTHDHTKEAETRLLSLSIKLKIGRGKDESRFWQQIFVFWFATAIITTTVFFLGWGT
jgi:hypothetical protein